MSLYNRFANFGNRDNYNISTKPIPAEDKFFLTADDENFITADDEYFNVR